MIDEAALKRIEELHRLQKEGIISAEEFEKAKQSILFNPRPTRKAATAIAARSDDLPDPENWFDWMVLPLRKYADFTGRSSRKEFWMFMLLALIVSFACMIYFAIDEDGPLGKLAIIALVVVILGTLVPSIAVTARRFHDLDKSGWFALLWLVPYLGVLVFIPMAIEGTRGDNRFGPDPLA